MIDYAKLDPLLSVSSVLCALKSIGLQVLARKATQHWVSSTPFGAPFCLPFLLTLVESTF